MNFNPLVIPALILALPLFWVGQALCERTPHRGARLALFTGAALAAVPAVLLAAYYLHVLDSNVWFYRFRSVRGVELAAAGAGLFAGVLSGATKRFRVFLRPPLLACLVLGIALPHFKPMHQPLDLNLLSDRWDGDVCRQTTLSTCGPACAATILRHFGVAATEKELAAECHSSAGGTEVWYLARALRKRGLDVKFRCGDGLPPELPLPAIAGVKIGGAGHVITILGRTPDGGMITGDPLHGRRKHSSGHLAKDYEFTGFFLLASKP